MIVKAKVSFGYYRNVNKDDIIELTELEYSRLKHLVEDTDEVSSIEKKPNKQYKKGRRK